MVFKHYYYFEKDYKILNKGELDLDNWEKLRNEGSDTNFQLKIALKNMNLIVKIIKHIENMQNVLSKYLEIYHSRELFHLDVEKEFLSGTL